MKLFIVLLVLFSFVTLQSSFAQMDSEKLLYLEKVEKYRRMKSTGKTLTVGGGILFVAGLVTLANSTSETYYNGSYYSTTTTGNPEAGALMYILGNVGLGAGIPLWIVGKNNYRKYSNKLESLSVGIQANPQVAGVALTYKF